MIRVTGALALLAAGLPSGVAAQEVISCILRPVNEIEIGTPVAGLLEDIAVDRGDQVEEGQVLGRIEARVQEAQLAVARQRAGSTAAEDARSARLAEAERQLDQVQKLVERGVATRVQLDEASAAVQVARAELTEAQDARLAAQLEVAAAEAAVALRVIRAPVSGRVLARHVDAGEYAAADEPLLDLVTTDRLHAEILLSADAYGRFAPGDPVGIETETGTVRRDGIVDAIDPIIDAASRSFGIRVILDNADDAFPAGVRCGAVFD